MVVDWLVILTKWLHVVAGIAWIGASFYFIWLDNHLEEPSLLKQQKGIKGELWAIHSGGFYEVQKYRQGPATLPSTLHWFKWEAYTTWLSGTLLLILIYYFNADIYLVDQDSLFTNSSHAILFGAMYVLSGLACYELLCRLLSNHGAWVRHSVLGTLFIIAILLACFVLPGRAAYIHVGALVGTIMAANVFTTIIPSQRKMVSAVEQNQKVRPSWGEKAKQRSVHNNYLTLPLIFTMISNHFAFTYQHAYNGLILVVIFVLSAYCRHFFNLRHQGHVRYSILAVCGVGVLITAYIVNKTRTAHHAFDVAEGAIQTIQPSSNIEHAVYGVVAQHCLQCHSATPTHAAFSAPPMGLVLDDWAQIKQASQSIYRRTYVTQDMPLLDEHQITDSERALIGAWYQAL
ncbi:urate hydroxylase PuuD [Aestuariibacter sp. AA17]|uniref:Urate hydroxylase PuuD n=1 Tax=Fluctibacter corallii TaxID=2984329 RepID=A0ABT3A6C8_9ALTE|nr:urate hydroxylase PuuD [Aestuariibacter sp. AA17]MCV2884234.1 urate hydroxylase PuuD [Aestuariibacter sp. AA17]